MELTILGIHSPYPWQGRATVGYAVQQDQTVLLVEAGCGTYRRLVEEGLLARVAAIVQSHLHYDHCADLPAVILGATLGQGRTEPLPVFLPPGESERLRRWLDACGFSFVWQHLAPTELTYGLPAACGGIQITMQPAQHSLPAGIITLTAGGKRLVYTGDTADCSSLRASLGGADLVLAEVTGLAPDQAAQKGHLTAPSLGAIAQEAGIGDLVLTHFMPGADPEVLTIEVSRAFGRPAHPAREGQKYPI